MTWLFCCCHQGGCWHRLLSGGLTWQWPTPLEVIGAGSIPGSGSKNSIRGDNSREAHGSAEALIRGTVKKTTSNACQGNHHSQWSPSSSSSPNPTSRGPQAISVMAQMVPIGWEGESGNVGLSSGAHSTLPTATSEHSERPWNMQRQQ